MSKQITPSNLSQLVSAMLTNPSNIGELESREAYASFFTAVAKVVCDHVGGEVIASAEPLDTEWYVAITGNDSLPAGGGVWAQFDKEGRLYAPETREGALEVLHGYGDGVVLADVYDQDEALSQALCTLIDDFEYPDWSHKTVRQIFNQLAN